MTLTVIDGNGCTVVLTRDDYIQLRPLDVGFLRDPEDGCTPLDVMLTDTTSSPDPIVSWSWDFGDATTGTGLPT